MTNNRGHIHRTNSRGKLTRGTEYAVQLTDNQIQEHRWIRAQCKNRITSLVSDSVNSYKTDNTKQMDETDKQQGTGLRT